jgi:hypothetical protein
MRTGYKNAAWPLEKRDFRGWSEKIKLRSKKNTKKWQKKMLENKREKKKVSPWEIFGGKGIDVFRN